MDYYEQKFRGSGAYLKIIWVSLKVILAAMAVMFFIELFLGCKTWNKNISEKQDTKDSVRIEYIEKVVKVPVTVEVEVPVEVKERFSRDSTSHLETRFAVSDASMVWIDGVAFLRHSLENIPQKIQKQDSVQIVEKEKTVWKTRRVTYNKTEIREKRLAWWQTGLMYIGGFSLFIILIVLVIKVLRR